MGHALEFFSVALLSHKGSKRLWMSPGFPGRTRSRVPGVGGSETAQSQDKGSSTL